MAAHRPVKAIRVRPAVAARRTAVEVRGHAAAACVCCKSEEGRRSSHPFARPVCRLIGYQLDRLLKSLLPRLWRHFQDVGLSFEVLAAQWLLPLMSITLPFPTLARIWELFFAEVRGRRHRALSLFARSPLSMVRRRRAGSCCFAWRWPCLLRWSRGSWSSMSAT